MGQKEINIGTIAGLLEALDDPNAMIRTGTLQAIAGRPEKATSLATKGGVDLFLELSKRCETPREASLRAYYIQALLNLNDDRGDTLARETFLAMDDTDIILLCARRLASLPETERIAFLGPVALSPDEPTRTRAAANLLAGCKNLPTRLAIRVAILADQAPGIPPLDDGNLPDWLEELQGPYPRRTRKLLRGKQDGTFAALLERWERLPTAVRLWAFNEAANADPDGVGPLVGEILARETDDDLLLAALTAYPQLGAIAVEEKLIAPFQRHKNPVLRAAAVRASRIDLDCVGMLAEERDPEVKIALITRLGEEVSGDSLPQLAAYLEDQDWRVRTATTAALVTLAPASVPLLQESFCRGNPLVRSAAGQALQQLGKEEWLATQLAAEVQ